jgi:hypothetical protein
MSKEFLPSVDIHDDVGIAEYLGMFFHWRVDAAVSSAYNFVQYSDPFAKVHPHK